MGVTVFRRVCPEKQRRWRRFDRITASDVALRDRKLAFHLGDEPPRITRNLMETTVSTS